MKKNELIGEIVDFDYKGMGITKIDSMPVFLNGGLIGDKILFKITEKKKSFYKGEILKILSPSADRKKSPCKYSKVCGGCDFLTYKYEKSLEWKKSSVENKLRRISNINTNVSKIHSAEETTRYRNNMQFQVKDGKIGLYKKNSNEIVKVSYCLMQSENANKVLGILGNFKNINKIKTIGIRTNYKDQVMLILSAKEKINKLHLILPKLLDANVVSIYENINMDSKFHYGKEFNLIYGEDHLLEKVNDFYYKLSPKSFFQVNRLQAEKLYKRAMDFLNVNKDETICDLYCGVGTLSLEIALRGARVIGVEIVEDAVNDARENAKENGLEARFIAGRSEEILEKLEDGEKIIIDKILVDPPRKGLDKTLVEYLKEKSYSKIVYISCNAATLTRDLEMLKETYKVEKIEIFDLFPNTVSIETLALLSK